MNAIQTAVVAEAEQARRDSVLIQTIQDGLPLVERPYAAIGETIGLNEDEVIAHIGTLIDRGDIKRFGVVVRHKEIGYGSNAMVVWDLPDAWVDRLGERIGQMPFVTLCYRRPRRLPDWPYNLFSMIHGRSPESVLDQVEQIKQRAGLQDVNYAVLFSGKRFKQRGARYGAPAAHECDRRPRLIDPTNASDRPEYSRTALR